MQQEKLEHYFFRNHAGFPEEIEFDMLMVGIATCDPLYDRFIASSDENLLQITYHCASLGSLKLNEKERPTAFPLEGMTEECLDYETAFESQNLHSIGDRCTPYAIERVSAEWRCRDQCLAYFINHFNYEKYTYTGKACKAVVAYKENGVVHCKLYDWLPHEHPLEFLEQTQFGCEVIDNVAGHHLYLLKTDCHPVTTPTPGYWEPPTAIAYIPKMGCTTPHKAFHRSRSKEIVCPSAVFWKARGVNPPRERNRREHAKDYFKDFLNDGEELIDQMIQKYGQNWNNAHVKDGPLMLNYHVWHCQMNCLEMRGKYMQKEYDSPCKAVLVVAPTSGNFKFTCIYKNWPRADTDECVSIGGPSLEMPGYDFYEFYVKRECYQPPDALPHVPHQISTTVAQPPRPTAPQGYPDNYERCFTKTEPTEVTALFKAEGEKLLTCVTNNKPANKIGSDQAEATSGYNCAMDCLNAAKSYWYRRQHIAADEPDCKGYAVRVLPSTDDKHPYECIYFTWKRGERITECKETDNKDNYKLYVLDDPCQEPQGIALRTCPKFEDMKFMTIYTLVTEDGTKVHHGGKVLFECYATRLARFDCTDGKWVRYCEEHSIDVPFGSLIMNTKDIVDYPCYGTKTWHYSFQFSKWYKVWTKSVEFVNAYELCKDNCDGKMVSIHSKEENEYISEITEHREAWIGLKKDHATGKWRWEDDSDVTYRSDLGRCPLLECTCKDGSKCTQSAVGQSTCVLSQFKEWYWAMEGDTCKTREADLTVCEYPMKLAVIKTPKDVDGDTTLEPDGERKQEVWDDICRQADRMGNKAQLAICKEVRKCQKYLEREGKHAATPKAHKCRALLQGEQKKCRKYSVKWCRDKVQEYGRDRPHLKCVKKCNGILAIMGKYTVPWCKAKIDNHGKNRPDLMCVKKCRKMIEEGQTTKPSQKPEKFGYEYCMEKIEKHKKKTNLSCIKLCRKKFH